VREIQLAAAHTTMTTTEGYLDQYRERLSEARLRDAIRAAAAFAEGLIGPSKPPKT
jgi:hypothetical protein